MAKVFISWSGKRAESVALALRDWLPLVLHDVKPFVSTEDIAKGSRWFQEVSRQLDEAQFGIVVVTNENAAEPFLLFEAGALARKVDLNHVSPFLVDFRTSDLTGPLKEFQATTVDLTDIQRLIWDINTASGGDVPRERSDRMVQRWWPDLSTAIEDVRNMTVSKATVPRASTDMLEEILDAVRSLKRQVPVAYQTKTVAVPIPPGKIVGALDGEGTLGVPAGGSAEKLLAAGGEISNVAVDGERAKITIDVLVTDANLDLVKEIYRSEPGSIEIIAEEAQGGVDPS